MSSSSNKKLLSACVYEARQLQKKYATILSGFSRIQACVDQVLDPKQAGLDAEIQALYRILPAGISVDLHEEHHAKIEIILKLYADFTQTLQNVRLQKTLELPSFESDEFVLAELYGMTKELFFYTRGCRVFEGPMPERAADDKLMNETAKAGYTCLWKRLEHPELMANIREKESIFKRQIEKLKTMSYPRAAFDAIQTNEGETSPEGSYQPLQSNPPPFNPALGTSAEGYQVQDLPVPNVPPPSYQYVALSRAEGPMDEKLRQPTTSSTKILVISLNSQINNNMLMFASGQWDKSAIEACLLSVEKCLIESVENFASLNQAHVGEARDLVFLAKMHQQFGFYMTYLDRRMELLKEYKAMDPDAKSTLQEEPCYRWTWITPTYGRISSLMQEIINEVCRKPRSPADEKALSNPGKRLPDLPPDLETFVNEMSLAVIKPYQRKPGQAVNLPWCESHLKAEKQVLAECEKRLKDYEKDASLYVGHTLFNFERRYVEITIKSCKESIKNLEADIPKKKWYSCC